MEHPDALSARDMFALAHERHHDAAVGGTADRAIFDIRFLTMHFGAHLRRLGREHEQLSLDHVQLLAAAARGRERATRRGDFGRRLAVGFLCLLICDAGTIHLLRRDVFTLVQAACAVLLEACVLQRRLNGGELSFGRRDAAHFRLVLAERLLVDLAGLCAQNRHLAVDRLQPRKEHFPVQRRVAIVDAGDHVALPDLVPLDHVQLGDPARDTARYRDHFSIDPGVVDVNVRPSMHEPHAGPDQHADDGGADQPDL